MNKVKILAEIEEILSNYSVNPAYHNQFAVRLVDHPTVAQKIYQILTAQEGEINCPDCAQIDCPYFQDSYDAISVAKQAYSNYLDWDEGMTFP